MATSYGKLRRGVLKVERVTVARRNRRLPAIVRYQMKFLEAIALALQTIRVQKLKSFFTMIGVCIGVTFLITVVSIVNGMGRYMEDELVGKLIALNSFELRNRPNINLGDVPREVWMEYNRRPRIYETDVQPVVEALPPNALWAMYSTDGVSVESPFSRPRRADATAVDGQFFEIKKLDVTEGRRFSPEELTSGRSVVILGPDLVKRLFPPGRVPMPAGKLRKTFQNPPAPSPTEIWRIAR